MGFQTQCSEQVKSVRKDEAKWAPNVRTPNAPCKRKGGLHLSGLTAAIGYGKKRGTEILQILFID